MNRKQHSLAVLHSRLSEELSAIRRYETLSETNGSILFLLNQHKSVFIELYNYIEASPQWKSRVLSEGEEKEGAALHHLNWLSILDAEKKRRDAYDLLTVDHQFDAESRRFVIRQVIPCYDRIVEIVTVETRTLVLSDRACAG